jgi:hypothetical protein
VRARGFDSVVSRGIGAHVKAALSYSIWKVTQAGLDGVWRAGDYDIRHQTRATLGYSRAAWNASASWRYASGRPYTPYDIAASSRARSGRYDLAKVNAERYPAYHRLDVRAERAFKLGKTVLTAYGEVDNLYDRTNIYLYEWDNAAKASKAVDQWGLTPVAGVRVTF